MKLVQSKHLTSEKDIVPYFTDAGHDLLECGQGYATESDSYIVQINGDTFEVEIEAEIGSSWQDRGDRLYFIERITSVEYKKVDTKVVTELQRQELEDTLSTALKLVATAERALAEFDAELL